MTKRDNILRAIRFERPNYIPMAFHINDACWHHYDQNILQDLMEVHPPFSFRISKDRKYYLRDISLMH